MSDWTPAYVTVGDLGPFRAQVATFTRWNGWACPRFTREVAEEIVQAVQEQNQRLGADDGDRLTWDGEVIVHVHPMYADEPGYRPERIEPDADGWYQIGSYQWTWYELWCQGAHAPAETVHPVAIAKNIKPAVYTWPRPRLAFDDQAYCADCLEQVRAVHPEATVSMLPPLPPT